MRRLPIRTDLNSAELRALARRETRPAFPVPVCDRPRAGRHLRWPVTSMNTVSPVRVQ
jgi:hypothetical protein